MRVVLALVALVVMAQVIAAADPQSTTLQPTKNPNGDDAKKGATVLTKDGNAPADKGCTGDKCAQGNNTKTATVTPQAPCCCQQQVQGCNTCAVSQCPKLETVQPEIISKPKCDSPCAVKDNKCSCPEHVQPELREKNACPCAGSTPCGCSSSSISGSTVAPETSAPHVKPELKEKDSSCGCYFAKTTPCPCAASFVELPSNN
jgi:hypothetical protein